MLTERPDSVPLGMPSTEALQMATDAVRRGYVLPEIMQHPEIRAECLRTAYPIQAYGLASCQAGEKRQHAQSAGRCDEVCSDLQERQQRGCEKLGSGRACALDQSANFPVPSLAVLDGCV